MPGYIFYLLLIFTTLIIAWQDFKERLVSLWALLLYLLNIALYTFFSGGWWVLLENGIGALCYFGICFAVLFLYYFLKEKKIPKIVDAKIGKADLLLLLAIGLSLPLVSLILFFTIAFTLSALFAVVVLKDKRSVPLAGILALIYFVFALFRNHLDL